MRRDGKARPQAPLPAPPWHTFRKAPSPSGDVGTYSYMRTGVNKKMSENQKPGRGQIKRPDISP